MKTYVINLERSPERKSYMERQLEKIPFLSVEFITAVDGKAMSAEERQKRFDSESFEKRYAKEVRPGEIGCTLSHQKCYRHFLESGEKCVLIVEDDIIISFEMKEVISRIDSLMESKEPRIILLSGWFWYGKTEDLDGTYRLARVKDAFLTHSYVINRAAAALLIEERPGITADDWKYIRKRGVKLQAVLPHLISQNWSGECPTLIDTGKRRSLRGYWKVKLKIRYHAAVLQMWRLFGKFEKA